MSPRNAIHRPHRNINIIIQLETVFFLLNFREKTSSEYHRGGWQRRIKCEIFSSNSLKWNRLNKKKNVSLTRYALEPKMSDITGFRFQFIKKKNFMRKKYSETSVWWKKNNTKISQRTTRKRIVCVHCWLRSHMSEIRSRHGDGIASSTKPCWCSGRALWCIENNFSAVGWSSFLGSKCFYPFKYEVDIQCDPLCILVNLVCFGFHSLSHFDCVFLKQKRNDIWTFERTVVHMQNVNNVNVGRRKTLETLRKFT